MSETKYCQQCFECKNIKTECHPNDQGNHCEKCIRNFNLQICDNCGKYKARTQFGTDGETCLDCQWHGIKTCDGCEQDKALILFPRNMKYCGECCFKIKKKCKGCNNKECYYKLDNGEYCYMCQQKTSLKCTNCNKKYIYSDFYFSERRIWCKKCVVNNICKPNNRLLIQYEPFSDIIFKEY